MDTFAPAHPTINLFTPLYYQLVYTLTDLLPPPLDDTPEALHTGKHAAIAKLAALLQVNTNEADLAPSFACSVAQCIAARAHAEEMLRRLRQNADDIGLVTRMNAQYGSMVRTSHSVQGRLMRMQALRRKREAIDGAANQDAWALHIAERSMLGVVDPDAGPQTTAWPETARTALPGEVPAADMDRRIKEHVSEDGTNSQDTAFETWLNAQFQGRGSGPLDGNRLLEVMRDAMAKPRPARSGIA